MKLYNYRYQLYAREDRQSELMKESDKIHDLKPIKIIWREQIKIPSVYPCIWDNKLNKWVE